jgi:adenosine deaminase
MTIIDIQERKMCSPCKSRPPKIGYLPCVILISSVAAFSQSVAKRPSTGLAEHEQRTARALEQARANPLELRAFLKDMPKGADLHSHLTGAVYAESWIRAAAEDRLCVSLEKLAFSQPEGENVGGAAQPYCGEGKLPAAIALKDQHLFDALVDSFSMRGFVPSPGVTGHDHFFDTFSKFGGVSHAHFGEWLDEVATRAAAQNEQLLELMHTPEFPHTAALAKEIGWHPDLAQLRADLLKRGFGEDMTHARKSLDQAESLRQQGEHCGQPDQARACQVQIRYLCQILRGNPKEQVFAQSLFCFEVASADQRFVGINLVMPEDGTVSMSDYALHMRMVGFLHEIYPKVHISLHAGELAPGVVPYEGLCCHIRLAIEQAHAERIGHGVDITYEDRPFDLLKEMASQHVMTEINLTSNEVILGISGKEHPLPMYRKFHVPVALSTDDEGVSRIDLTHEFVSAVETFGLRYADLKALVRTSLEHSFLPGASLWSAQDQFTRPVSACSRNSLGAEAPSTQCASFLKTSEKAQQQWELEGRFRIFESKF